MAKFRDPDTDEVVDISVTRTKFSGGEKIHCDNSGKQLVNKDGKPLIEVPRSEWDPNYDPRDVPSVASFSMKSREEKKKVLKRRSTDHFKKEIRERQANMNGETGKQI